MITHSRKKALIFCENNTLSEDCVRVRVQLLDGKKVTYVCTPYQALNHILKYRFIWFSETPW